MPTTMINFIFVDLIPEEIRQIEINFFHNPKFSFMQVTKFKTIREIKLRYDKKEEKN